jgi:hypothetical protein
VSAFMKVVVGQLLMKYDFTLVEPDALRWISWRLPKIPRPWTKLAFRERAYDMVAFSLLYALLVGLFVSGFRIFRDMYFEAVVQQSSTTCDSCARFSPPIEILFL